MRAGCRHANGRSQLALDASLRVLDVNHELHGLGLRVVEKLRERVDRREQTFREENRSSHSAVVRSVKRSWSISLSSSRRSTRFTFVS